MKPHNKKRNAGLMFEFIVRQISASIVDGNDEQANKATLLLKKYFTSGTELYREFRIFNALIKTTASSESVASSIMSEAKLALRRLDQTKLNNEKTNLIHESNRIFDQETFYVQQVPNYKLFATIGTLFSDWTLTNENIERLIEYEQKLIKYLCEQKLVQKLEDHKEPKVDQLVVKLMTKKLNEKYSHLTDNERNMIKKYVFIASDADKQSFISELNTLRVDGLKKIDEVTKKDKAQQPVLSEVKEILSYEITELDDLTVETYMKVDKLIKEISK